MSTVSATVISPAMVDDRGANVPDWANAAESGITGYRFQPKTAAEVVDMGRQGTDELFRFSGPDYPLTMHDRVRIAGVVYEVASVAHWPSITGGMAHLEAVLEHVEG